MRHNTPPPQRPGESLPEYVKRILDRGPDQRVVELIRSTEQSPLGRARSGESKVVQELRHRVEEQLRVISEQQQRLWELENGK